MGQENKHRTDITNEYYKTSLISALAALMSATIKNLYPFANQYRLSKWFYFISVLLCIVFFLNNNNNNNICDDFTSPAHKFKGPPVLSQLFQVRATMYPPHLRLFHQDSKRAYFLSGKYHPPSSPQVLWV